MLLVTQEQDQAKSQDCARVCRNLHFMTFHTPFCNFKKTPQISSAAGMPRPNNVSFLLWTHPIVFEESSKAQD